MAKKDDDEGGGELAELRAELRDAVARFEQALETGSPVRQQRAARTLEDEFSAEELQQLRDTREFERFRRLAERYGAELEQEADAAYDADEDGDDDEGDDDEGELEEAPKRKPKAKAKAKPAGGRHPVPAVDEEPVGEAKGPLSWLVS